MQLTKPDVVTAAISILDEYGLGDLTMRRLATQLGVQPGALYWHFPNKQALLGAVADRILDPISRPSGGPEVSVVALATQFRDCLLSCRDGAEVVSAAYAARLTKSPIKTYLADALAHAPEPDKSADALVFYTLGHTLDEQSRLQFDSAGALGDQPPAAFESADARFAHGLRVFVVGVGALSASLGSS